MSERTGPRRSREEVLVEELARKSRELDAFSHSVSHDLRAPLHVITGFSDVLLEDHGAALGEEGRRHLALIREASQRMSRLIEALAELSRLGNADLERAPLDLSQLARAIGEDVLKREGRQVELVVQPGLIANADAGLVRVALEQLFANAWKFTARCANPRVEVRGERDADGEDVYSVRDNGVGFDMAYAHRLFAPFQRLHPDREYPGVGVGLATVQRIVGRHGGRAWAEAAPGVGASVFFTLPGPPR